MSGTLVLVRHGQSLWNLENRFTGWVDVPLTEKGRKQAKEAGQKIQKEGFFFNQAHTSYLQRAICTLWIALQEMDQMWIPVEKTWRLNERHYGALQGLNKKECATQYGEEQVLSWRRGYDSTPPPVSNSQSLGQFQEATGQSPRYGQIPNRELPNGESLKQCEKRVQVYWEKHIIPHWPPKGYVLICAHGNSLRSLIKIIGSMDEEEIVQFEFATGAPLVCHINSQFLIEEKHWL